MLYKTSALEYMKGWAMEMAAPWPQQRENCGAGASMEVAWGSVCEWPAKMWDYDVLQRIRLLEELLSKGSKKEQKGAMMLHLLPGWRHYQLNECTKALKAAAGRAVRLRSWKKEKIISIFPPLSSPVPSPHPTLYYPYLYSPTLCSSSPSPSELLVIKISSLSPCLGPFSLPFNDLPPSNSPSASPHPLTKSLPNKI